MKVFISSTIHDLKDVRFSLRDEFIRCGFDPVLSEIGSMQIEPDQHSYDACIRAAEECDIVVGIIDSRAGGIIRSGEYMDMTITQAEMEAALKKGRLVYAFARRAITDAEHVYKAYMRAPQKTGDPEQCAFRKTPNLVEKEETLNFIEKWRTKGTGNWIIPFETPGDIVRHVLRQLEMTGKHHGVLSLHEVDLALSQLRFQLESLSTNLNFFAGNDHLDTSGGKVSSGMFDLFRKSVQNRIAYCRGELAKLSAGTLDVAGDACVDMTRNCFRMASRTVQATSFPAHKFWKHGEDSYYLQANREALERNVDVTRYFVFPNKTESIKMFEDSEFVAAMNSHLQVSRDAMVSGKGKYVIKLVNPEPLWINWLGSPRQQIPDISYFDQLVESEWTRRSEAEIPSSARISMVGPRRQEVSALFDALDRDIDTKIVTKFDEIAKFVSGWKKGANNTIPADARQC